MHWIEPTAPQNSATEQCQRTVVQNGARCRISSRLVGCVITFKWSQMRPMSRMANLLSISTIYETRSQARPRLQTRSLCWRRIIPPAVKDLQPSAKAATGREDEPRQAQQQPGIHAAIIKQACNQTMQPGSQATQHSSSQANRQLAATKPPCSHAGKQASKQASKQTEKKREARQ